MATNTRTPLQREKDRAEIAARYCRGERQDSIATALGMTQEMVCYDLNVIRGRWRRSALLDFDARQALELAKVDELERVYWQAWDRSKQTRETTSTKKVDGKEAKIEAAMSRQQLLGDPRFLAGVQWCIERRCKLLGIDAPERRQVSGPDGGPIPIAGTVTVFIPDNERGDRGNG